MRIELGSVDDYDSGTHTAAVTLLQGPTARLVGVACAKQCQAAELTAGTACLVLMTDDNQAILLVTY